MKIDIITIFPEMFVGPFSESMLKIAQEKGLAELNIINLRDFTEDKHKVTDDKPYGGGCGMVMKVEPLFKAVRSLKTKDSKVIVMSPAGEVFTQAKAKALVNESHLIIICGHYEGIDQRVIDTLVDMELSIGQYILTNGALASMVITDAVVRLIPGVLGGGENAVAEESFSDGENIEYPHYTRPYDFEGHKVPDILLSGNHKEIEKWRIAKANEKTLKYKDK